MIVCKECGSIAVQLMAWVDPNQGNKVLDDVGPWDSEQNNWCEDCGMHVALTRKEEKPDEGGE